MFPLSQMSIWLIRIRSISFDSVFVVSPVSVIESPPPAVFTDVQVDLDSLGVLFEWEAERQYANDRFEVEVGPSGWTTASVVEGEERLDETRRYMFRVPGVEAGDQRMRVRAVSSDSFSVVSEVRTFQVPAPVEFFLVLPREMGGEIRLDWQTGVQFNLEKFEIQVHHVNGPVTREAVPADSGGYWVTVGEIPAEGYSNRQTIDYGFDVPTQPRGKQILRIRGVTFDGRYVVSPEVTVDIPYQGSHAIISAFPNPFSRQSTFIVTPMEAQHMQVLVTDALGRRVALLYDAPAQANRSYRFTFDADGLSSGVYYYRVVGERFDETRQFVLLR